MVRFKGTPPYAQFVELGKMPYPGQPTIPYHRLITAAFGAPTTTRNDDGTYSHTWEFSDPFASPSHRRPTVRPIAVIEREIRRAAVPGLRREDV